MDKIADLGKNYAGRNWLGQRCTGEWLEGRLTHGLGPVEEEEAGQASGAGGWARRRGRGRVPRCRGVRSTEAGAARALVLLFEAGSCGRRLEQSSDERAKGPDPGGEGGTAMAPWLGGVQAANRGGLSESQRPWLGW